MAYDSVKLKPLHADGFRVEAWNEEDSTVVNAVLAATVAEDMTIPTGAVAVRLISDTDLWYNLTTTAVVPSDDSSLATLLPAGGERWINISPAITAISLISSGAAKVCGNFWA